MEVKSCRKPVQKFDEIIVYNDFIEVWKQTKERRRDKFMRMNRTRKRNKNPKERMMLWKVYIINYRNYTFYRSFDLMKIKYWK